MKTTKLSLLLATAGLAFSLTAQATYLIGSSTSNRGQLEIFDTDSNSITVLGSSLPNRGRLDGITYAGGDTLYGLRTRNNRSILYKFVLNQSHTDFTTERIGRITGLARPKGLSYVNGALYIHNNRDNFTDLYEVNAATAATSFVQSYSGRKNLQGTATYNELEYYIQRRGGNQTSVGYFDYSAPTPTDNTTGITINSGNLRGLAYADTTLYGISNDGLYAIDVDAGTYQNVYSGWGNNIRGLSVIGPAITAVPEPNSLIAFVIVAVGGILLQRKHVKAKKT